MVKYLIVTSLQSEFPYVFDKLVVGNRNVLVNILTISLPDFSKLKS